MNLTSFIDKVIFEKEVQTLPAVWGTKLLIITFIKITGPYRKPNKSSRQRPDQHLLK